MPKRIIRGFPAEMRPSPNSPGWKLPQPRVAVYLALTLLLLTPQALPLAAAEPESSTEKLETVRGQIKKIQRTQTKNKQQQKELNKQLKKLDRAINDLGATIADLQQSSRVEQAQINQLETRLAEQLNRLGKHKKLLSHLVRRAYLNGQQEYLKLLLNQQNPADIQRMLSFYGYLQHAHVAEITDLKAAITELQTTQNQLATTKQEAGETLDKISVQQATLAARRSEQTTILASLEADYQDNQSQLNKMRKNEARLADLVTDIQQTFTDVPDSAGRSFASLRGALDWPAAGRIKHRFGQRKQGTRLSWQGVLIDTPNRSKVHAVHAGRVAFADWLRGFGLLIIIDHGDNYMTIYGHNQTIQRDSGDWVKQGEVIATAGNGRGETESGLYFEIRHKGKPTNPAKWCRD
ncbi:MAG: hypothetical protein DRQ52_04490 [Gammaproteobacteria bacterium]|nr:MAG: hypothetical protein DRQ52_04490 [Gammaproteobacteria bacterium]